MIVIRFRVNFLIIQRSTEFIHDYLDLHFIQDVILHFLSPIRIAREVFIIHVLLIHQTKVPSTLPQNQVVTGTYIVICLNSVIIILSKELEYL